MAEKPIGYEVPPNKLTGEGGYSTKDVSGAFKPGAKPIYRSGGGGGQSRVSKEALQEYINKAKAEAERKAQEQQTRQALADLSRQYNQDLRNIEGVSGRTDRLKKYQSDRERITGGRKDIVAGGINTGSAVTRDTKTGEIKRTEETIRGRAGEKIVIKKDYTSGTERIDTYGIGGGRTGSSYAKEVKQEKEIKDDKKNIVLPSYESQFTKPTRSTRTDLRYEDVRPKKLDIKKEVVKEYESKPVQYIVSGVKANWEDIKEGSTIIAGAVSSIPLSLNILTPSKTEQKVIEKVTGKTTPQTLGELGESGRNLFSSTVRVGTENVIFFGKEGGKVLAGKQSLQEFGSIFIPKKRPDVVYDLDAGVVRETTEQERKPVTVFNIPKTTPKSQATSKAVEFVSYFTPAFVPLVTGDIAKSSEEIKRLKERTDLPEIQKKQLIEREKTEIGIGAGLLLGVGAFKAYKGLTAQRTIKIKDAETKIFRVQKYSQEGKNIFSRVTQTTPEKYKTSSAIQDLFGKGEIKSTKKYGQIKVETPEEVTKVGKTYTLLTKKVSKAPTEILSEEKIRLLLRDTKFQPVIKTSLVEPKLLGMKTEGAITDIISVVKSTPKEKFSIKKVRRPSELYKEQQFRETYQLPSVKTPKTQIEFDVKAVRNVDAKPTIDILTTRVKKLPQLSETRQVYLSETSAREIRKGKSYGKVSEESSTILELIKPEESKVGTSFKGGRKKSSPEFLQKLYQEQPQLPAPKVKPTKPSTQITETIVKDTRIETPSMVGGAGLKTIPYQGTGQYELTQTNAAPLSINLGTQPQLQEPQLNIISDIKLDTAQKTDIKIIQEPKLKTSQKMIIDIKPDTKIDSRADTKIDSKIDTQLKMKLKTKQKLKTMLDVVKLQRQITKPKERPIKTPTIKIPKLTEDSKIKVIKEAEKVLDGFKVFVTKAGKDVELETFGTLGEAKKALKTTLSETLRAGGFIKTKGEKIKINLGGGFRKSKIDPFKVVQLKERRLSRKPETREIQFFRRKKGGF